MNVTGRLSAKSSLILVENKLLFAERDGSSYQGGKDQWGETAFELGLFNSICGYLPA